MRPVVSRLERDRYAEQQRGQADPYRNHTPLPAQLVTPQPWQWWIGGGLDIRRWRGRGQAEHETSVAQYDAIVDCMGGFLARGFHEVLTVQAPV